MRAIQTELQIVASTKLILYLGRGIRLRVAREREGCAESKQIDRRVAEGAEEKGGGKKVPHPMFVGALAATCSIALTATSLCALTARVEGCGSQR